MALAQIQTLFQCLVNCTSGSQPPLNPVLDSAGLQYCTTPGCIESANNFLQSIDVNVDPCDNFYDHVCGKWERETRLPDEKSILSRFGIMDDVVTERLEALLMKPTETKSYSTREAADMFSNCIELDARESYGLKPLHTALQDLGGWPLLGNAKTTPADADLTKLLAIMARDYASMPLIQSSVGIDDFHPENYILWVYEGSLGLPGRDYYVVEDNDYIEKLRRGYLDFMVNVGALLLRDLGKPVDKESLKGTFEKVLALEQKIAKAHRTPVQERDPWSQMNYYTLNNATESFSWLNWSEYLKVLMPSETQKLISESFTHLNAAPKYFSDMNTIVQEADKETLINYVYWRFVQDWAYSMNKDLRKLVDEFDTIKTGQKAPEPMWKHCVSVVHRGALHKAAGAMYARKYFQGDFKDKSENLVKTIMHHFKEQILKTSTFMDPDTLKKALEKSVEMEPMVTYPDYVMNDTALDGEYKDLSLPVNGSYVTKSASLNKWHVKNELLKLLRPYERKFESSSAVVNAFYNPSANSIVIPGGILGAPFYSNDLFKAVNYGGIAAVVGHEVSHGFDDQGSQYDKTGKLTKWWSKESEKKFDDLKNCFVDQYGAYFVKQANMTINGNLTLGENIADNGGIRTAYLAYKNTLRKSEAFSLPGLEKYTNDQLFFLNYANIWCRKATDEYVVQNVRTDPHSPAEARVNLPLMNFDVFSRTFKCPVGSKMNPSSEFERCRLW